MEIKEEDIKVNINQIVIKPLNKKFIPNELKQQILENQKLRQLIEKRIESNKKLYLKLSPSPNIEYLKLDNDLLQSLLDEAKK